MMNENMQEMEVIDELKDKVHELVRLRNLVQEQDRGLKHKDKTMDLLKG